MSAPPQIVFVPGFMQRGDAWREVAEALAERYPSAVADLRAPTLGERLAELRDACPPGSLPVGYSMGGRLALHAALREPARFAGLVLVGVSAGIEDEAERARRRAADEELAAWIEAQPIERVVERWERNPVFASQAPELVAAQRAGRLSFAPAELASLLRSAGQGAMEPVWGRVPTLPMPLLAVAGASDAPYAAAARRLAALAPRGEHALVPGGHAPQLEHPDAFAAALLRWLERTFGSSRSR
jgi:2-succinyl-6-hydroxy-2,4-cyclohexadiene-1-carboxylate synthase